MRRGEPLQFPHEQALPLLALCLAADIADKNLRWKAPKFAAIFPDMDQKIAEIAGFFQAHFGQVVKVPGAQDIARAGVDVGVIIDMHPTQIPKMTMERARSTTKLIVVSGGDGRVLDTFSGEGVTGKRGSGRPRRCSARR